MIRQLFYVSVACEGMTQQQVDDILAVSRWNNARRDVTGCLLYAGGTFAQVLEGDAQTVTSLAAKIALDHRHRDVRTVLERDSALREYSNWSMGFVHNPAVARPLDGGVRPRPTHDCYRSHARSVQQPRQALKAGPR